MVDNKQEDGDKQKKEIVKDNKPNIREFTIAIDGKKLKKPIRVAEVYNIKQFINALQDKIIKFISVKAAIKSKRCIELLSQVIDTLPKQSGKVIKFSNLLTVRAQGHKYVINIAPQDNKKKSNIAKAFIDMLLCKKYAGKHIDLAEEDFFQNKKIKI